MSFAGGFIDLFGNGDKSRITKRNGKEVKGFIEYKERDEGLRVLRAVESIVCVLQSPDGDVFIRKSEEQLKISAEPVGDFVDGTFEEVKRKIQSEV